MVEITRKLFIEDALESREISQGFRLHTGASQAGKECPREIWYNFRWSKERTITPRVERLFNRGHLEELVVIKDLIKAGCRVEGINIDESIAETFKLLFNIDLTEQNQINAKFANGHGGASCDGVIHNLPDAPKTPHLLEVKTSNLKKFEKLKLDRVKKAFPQHYVQMQIYMHLFGLTRALYISVCKDNDQRHYERVEYDKGVAIEFIERSTQIISSEKAPPRLSNVEESFSCRWCDYKGICHQGHNPSFNCRTCNNSGMRDNGIWVCEIKKEKELNQKKQELGCKKYQLLKGFI